MALTPQFLSDWLRKSEFQPNVEGVPMQKLKNFTLYENRTDRMFHLQAGSGCGCGPTERGGKLDFQFSMDVTSNELHKLIEAEMTKFFKSVMVPKESEVGS